MKIKIASATKILNRKVNFEETNHAPIVLSSFGR
jgi:hypothetical protein